MPPNYPSAIRSLLVPITVGVLFGALCFGLRSSNLIFAILIGCNMAVLVHLGFRQKFRFNYDRYSTLFSSLPQIGMILTPAGEVRDANQYALEHVKSKRRDSGWTKFWDLELWNVCSETKRLLRAGLHQALLGQTAQVECQILSPLGQVKDVIVHLTPLYGTFQYGHAAQITEVLLQCQEVTHLKDVEQQNKNLQDQLDSVNHALDHIAIISKTDAQGRIVYVNDKFCQISQYSRQELHGQNHRIVNSGHHPPEFFQEMYQTIEQGLIWKGEMCNRAKDGSMYWVMCWIVPHQSQDRRITGFTSIRFDVTTQKAAEERLALSEYQHRVTKERLEMALGVTEQGTWDWNPQSDYLYFDESWTNIIGESLDRLSPHISEWQSRVHPDDIAHVKASLFKHFSGETHTFSSEHRLQHRDGSWRWVMLHGKVTARDEQGQPIRVVGTQVDITARHQVMDEMQNAKMHLSTLFNSMTEGVVMLDSLGNIIACNKSAEIILGLTQAQMMGLSVRDHRWQTIDEHGNDYPNERHPSIIALRTGEPQRNGTMGVIRGDGSRVWIRVNCEVVKDQQQNVTQVVASFHDVTHELETQWALNEERRRLETFVNHAPAAIAMFDCDMRYIAISKRWTSDYFLWDEEIIGRSHYDIFPDLPERWKESHQSALAGNVERNPDDTWHPPGFDEIQNVSWEIRPWYLAEGKVGGVMMYTQNITESKQREQEILKLQEKAEAANQSKSEFLANMSHEIRTPLTAIMGYTELLQEDGICSNPEKIKETTDRIHSAGDHLLAVINDILDLSKIEAGRMEVESIQVNLRQILSDVITLCRPTAVGKGVELKYIEQTSLPNEVLLDPTRFRQILLNMIGNACKFTEHGSIEVSVAVQPVGTGYQLLIDIEDSGMGMTSDVVDRLFKPFFQADSSMVRKFGGTGLGLAITRRLAQLMHGQVELVRTALGEGTQFRVELPLALVPGTAFVSLDDLQRQAGSELMKPQPTTMLDGHILFVEDGPDNQRLIAFFLRKAGAEVDVVDNGVLALKKLDEMKLAGQLYDLILTDIQMPEMDGYTLMRTLRGQNCQTAIIAITAHAMEKDRDNCFAAGCDDYTTKPINRETLLKLCSIWMGRRSEAATANVTDLSLNPGE
jgi:PAS domain S-box-containing protein